MQAIPVQKQMSPEQQAQLFRVAQIGLEWVSGQISFEDVTKRLGKPEYQNEQVDIIKYAYYPKGMSIRFVFDKLTLVNGKPAIYFFDIKIKDDVHTNIPYAEWERLGMRWIKRGESIEGVRAENGNFFWPMGILDVSGFLPKNYVTFVYRWPMPPGSTFDVTGRFGYLGERINKNRAPNLDNFRDVVDLRDFVFSRRDLTPRAR